MVNNSEKKQLMEAIIHYFHRHFPKHYKVEIIKQISAKLTKLKPSKKKKKSKQTGVQPIVWCPLGKLRCPWGNCTDSGRFIPPYHALFHSDLGEPWHTLAVSVATDC